MPSLARLVVLAALVAVGSGCARAHDGPYLDVGPLRWQRGDDPAWAAPGFDDAGWPRAALADIAEDGGPLWLRARVELRPGALPTDQPLGVLFAGLASHEMYWDGVRIGAGGRVAAAPADEVPGPLVAHHWLQPALAAPGTHTVALRLSAHHRRIPINQPLWGIRIASYDHLAALVREDTWIAIASGSALVLGAAFALIGYLLDRRERASLYLGALCLTAVALIAAESWRPLVGYTYEWHGPRLLAITALTWLLELFVVAFTVARLPRRGGRWFVALAGAAMACAVVAPGWDTVAALMFLLGQAFAFGWSLRAVRAGQRGSRTLAVVFAASLVLLLVLPERFGDATVFLLLDGLLVCLTAPYAVARARDRAARERAVIAAARLESELVRKHLQPHFLMNTLTALGEWIDEDPRVAGEMIEALGEELRALHAILDRPLISVDEELRLCRAHLAIMSLRSGRSYRLVSDGVDPGALLPPAVLHTLVENAVTHGPRQPATELVLTATRTAEHIRYALIAPLASTDPARPGRTARAGEGGGTRYIRARLAETYGARAAFTAGVVDGAWRSELTLPVEAR